MADALVSPAVGGTMWVATAGLIGYCSKKIKEDIDDRKIPLMGVLGVFIFAAQMINFTILATGSSGHLGGGITLAIIQGKTAFLPDYGFKKTGMHDSEEGCDAWPAVDPGTSVSGFVGGMLTLCMAVLIGFIVKRKKVANA